jgi:hypothetical protein
MNAAAPALQFPVPQDGQPSKRVDRCCITYEALPTIPPPSPHSCQFERSRTATEARRWALHYEAFPTIPSPTSSFLHTDGHSHRTTPSLVCATIPSDEENEPDGGQKCEAEKEGHMRPGQ